MKGNKCVVNRDRVIQVAKEFSNGKEFDLSPVKPSGTDRMAELSKEVDRLKSEKQNKPRIF